MEEFDEMDTVNPVISETCETQSDSLVSSYTNMAPKIEVLAESVAFHSQMDMLPIIHDSVESQVGHQQESILNPQSDNAPEESSYSTAANNNKVLSGQKTLGCETCGKQFFFKSELYIHERIHTGERPFACDQCNKKFSLSHNLVNHKRIHSGEKPYACNQCVLKFANKSNLVLHLANHTGEKPFACDQCAMKFVFKSSLANHKRTHTGEKPFNCDICGKSFAAKSNLSSHFKKTHSN